MRGGLARLGGLFGRSKVTPKPSPGAGSPTPRPVQPTPGNPKPDLPDGSTPTQPTPTTPAPRTKAEILDANRKAGRNFELEQLEKAKETQDNVVEQLTVKSKESGTKTRLDLAGKDKETGATELTECKASDTAPLTPNQQIAHPEIERSGAVVVGKGKPGFPPGTEIPPTRVRIKRPNDDRTTN